MLNLNISSKKKQLKFLPRSKIFHPHERETLVPAGVAWLLVFLIGKLQGLRSFHSKAFKKYFSLKCYTTLSLPKRRIFEKFG